MAIPDEAPVLRIEEALARALDGDAGAVARLEHADTSVAFRAPGQDGAVLLLDRVPTLIPAEDEPAEIEILFTAEQARRFVVGALPLTAAIVSGQVRAEGPVRKYLEVDPILRKLLGEGHAGSEYDGRSDAPEERITEAIDPALLAIETRDLHKSFGSNHILQGLNLAIPEGAISVILGPSGTGKSVCLQHVIGIMKPDAGDVLIRGRALSSMSRAEILGLRRTIGVMFQDGALFSAQNVYENVAFPLRQHTDFAESEIRQIVMEHLESVGLANAGSRMPNELSGGMRKRAGLARALALNPGIVLCDEPDSGLDPVRTALLGDLLVERHAEHGGTMVVVTHNIMLARSIADHISVVWRGKVLEAGMTEQILQSDTPFIEQFLSGAAHGPLTMDA
ncbi:ABC transporter ATP-binding protein [Paraconexibacter sp.]|uniref:ABC transporter ATP-binding protein n=1 Tax=Paraconexibacter sp. TaxID=2949640 RepID=UPI00356ACA97